MTYEIIGIEHGDVLYRTSDRDDAVERLCAYVQTHEAAQPGIERQVALVELDDEETRRGGFLTYEELAAEHAPRAAHA